MENLSKESDTIPSVNVKLTELQRMKLGFEKIIGYAWPKEDVKVFAGGDDISVKQGIFDFYVVYIIYVAQMMTTSESFMKLSLEDRVSYCNFLSQKYYIFMDIH